MNAVDARPTRPRTAQFHCLPVARGLTGWAVAMALVNIATLAHGADLAVTADVMQIVADYSWGYENALKQHQGSYKNGRSVQGNRINRC